MERTDTHIQHGRLRGVAGFSLIELLIGLAISSILALSLWSLASTQERTYGSQDSATEMQQNLRVALQCLTRDIMGAGLGPQSSTINGQDASAWYNAANNWNPFNITATSIDIIGCGQTPATLNAQAASGTNTLTLAAGEGAGFTASQNISIEGVENAVVTSVNGDTLTLDGNLSADPPVGGDRLSPAVGHLFGGGRRPQHGSARRQRGPGGRLQYHGNGDHRERRRSEGAHREPHGFDEQRHRACCLDGDGYGLPAE